ncbi:acyl- N-acyltransferase [Lecanosticta acicola]|uniref:Acyl- N-acyltransferase n=1 Tax=Lecanosticta acicola TaxID=111012 RepID=A0AAI8Z4P3_9PEZI|nr:acyl- N-acyltransferase [Lecanosticta acicola]
MTPNPDHLNNIAWPEEVQLRWATRADIPAITRILHANLLTFEFFDHFCPARKQHEAEFHAFVLSRVRMFFVRSGIRFMVAEKLQLGFIRGHESTTILGFSTWEPQGGDENPLAAEWQRQDSGWLKALERRLVDLEGWHHRCCRNTIVSYETFHRLRGLLHDSFDQVESLGCNLHLQYLMVHPKAQGYGVGHKLLQWGLDAAAQLGMPMILESSLAGHPFYLKHGFRVLKTIRIDDDPEKAYDMPLMVYEPEVQERESLS